MAKKVASVPLSCLPLRTVTDGPLFGQPEGTLASLQNMTLTKDGYAEARGGFEKPKPVGGTASDAIVTGGYGAVSELSTSYGWIRSFDSTIPRYSANQQLHAGGWLPFSTGLVTDALYFGADFPFSRVGAFLSVAAAFGTFTLVYEYSTGPGTWGTLTTTETINWASAYTMQYGSWRAPTDWVPSVVGDGGGSFNGNVYKYWMRIRLSVVVALVTSPRVQFAFGFWNGMREIYFTSGSPTAGTSIGIFGRQGVNGTTEEWFNTQTISSLVAAPMRMATYRGRVVMTNGRDTKRWDGANFADLGINGNVPLTGTVAGAALAAGMGAGIWRYYYAWGNGPCQNLSTYADRQDAQALYGPGRAYYIGEATTTAGVNERVQVELLTAPTAEVGAVYIYRTDDLTAIPAGKRANMPAYLVNSFRRATTATPGFEQAFGGVTNYWYDTQIDQAFPRQEARVYDVAPPTRTKYLTVYQNRLFLMDDETLYWSDPFQIDSFSGKSTTNYIRLTRATGGRNMGIYEFADQVVAYTEDQTWGVTNVDLDSVQLFPIHPEVGCVAPDAVASGDGWLIWPARDGFYAWNGGSGLPKKISDEFDQTFHKMSYETHGGSRATVEDHKYIFRQAAPDGSSSGTTCYVFDLETATWATLVPTSFASKIFPLATVHAPLGNSDAGGLHSIWGKIDYGTSGEFSLFLMNLTTQDNGTGYVCSGQMHFPLPASALFKPKRVLSYYSAADGWGTPTLSFTSGTIIGSDPGTLNSGTPDTAADYSLIGGTFSGVSSGTSDLKVTFSVTSSAGGTVQQQRFYGAVLEGEPAKVRRGGV